MYMKKSLLLVLMVIALIACNQNEVRVYTNTSAQDAVGKYVGTWSSISSSSGLETLYEGSIELAVFKDSVENVCMIYIVSEQAGWNYRGIANVSHAGDDIVFNNDKSGGNGIGADFYGRVFADGSATCAFSSIGKEGRKSVIFSNSFKGKKE